MSISSERNKKKTKPIKITDVMLPKKLANYILVLLSEKNKM